MKDLLPLLPKPSHYLGSEAGTVVKDPASVRGRVALAFPDLYGVGMSYMGHPILYDQVNRRDGLWAERVYAPALEAAEVLRAHGAPLCTLESGTPLSEMDVVAFSLTHELCYTNVLYMLELGNIPLRAQDRPEDAPLIVAGGGCVFNAEPVAPFFDLMILGDGEAALPELLELVADAREKGLQRAQIIDLLKDRPGVYAPSLFRPGGAPDGSMDTSENLAPVNATYERVEKRVLADLDGAGFPLSQPLAFDAVHDRLTIEIARGCTRGCRFCQAGMIYRPVRERSLPELNRILEQGLEQTGYAELSFLSLSAGDFSALAGLFDQSFSRCRDEQVAISLPSLRVGSVNEEIITLMAGLRRTGATLAPEAGSQRMRDVINKGITEKELIEHVRTLFDNGWQSVKLYFMIGLPTETREDLDAILDLCKKVEGVGYKQRRLQVSAAISPFVPKPHTPFQWDAQITFDEIRERIDYLRDIFRPYKRLRLKYHMPEMSTLEGVFARGDRSLAPVVEAAYRKGALFSSWNDHLNLDLWREALDECRVDIGSWFTERDTNGVLPWDHLTSGVSKRFLLAERKRALEGKLTEDCRYGACRACGVCTDRGGCELKGQGDVAHVLNLSERDQAVADKPAATKNVPEQKPAGPKLGPDGKPEKPKLPEHLTRKAAHLRFWYTKVGPAAYLSQLELQDVFERAMRRARMPIAFSQGYHPLPLLSFARALPVGVESDAEYFDVFVSEPLDEDEAARRVGAELPRGLQLLRAESLTMKKKQPQAIGESFDLLPAAGQDFSELAATWRAFAAKDSHEWVRMTRKGARTLDARTFFKVIDVEDGVVRLELDWGEKYVSPLALACEVMPAVPLNRFRLRKTGLTMPPA